MNFVNFSDIALYWVGFYVIDLSQYSDVTWASWCIKSSATRLFVIKLFRLASTSRWRHNGRDSVSNHKPHHCLLNCLFRRRSKKTSQLRDTGRCVGKSPWPVNSPHKWPVTRKCFHLMTSSWRKTSRRRITPPLRGNPSVTRGFPTQEASNTDKVSMPWRYHVLSTSS